MYSAGHNAPVPVHSEPVLLYPALTASILAPGATEPTVTVFYQLASLAAIGVGSLAMRSIPLNFLWFKPSGPTLLKLLLVTW